MAGLSPLTDAGGQPRIPAFDRAVPLPSGWNAYHAARYDWASQYFGPGSSFDRYALTGPGDQLVWADVVITSNDSLTQYPVEGCRAFHADSIADIQKVPLGESRSATALDYREAGSDR